jgi:hypothetical protein
MEKAATAGAKGSFGKALQWGAGLALVLCAAGPAGAQEADPVAGEVLLAQGPKEPPLRVQVQTTPLPRFDPDFGYQSPRVDVAVFPSRRRSGGLGAVFGISGFNASPLSPWMLQSPGVWPPRASVDLGLRWSQRVQSQQIDITAWRRMSAEDDAWHLVQMHQPLYGARVEMNLSAGRKPGFSAGGGFIGFQFESGARISVKRKNGGPMIYYRTAF